LPAGAARSPRQLVDDPNGSATSPRVLLFTESTVTQAALVKALAKRFGLAWSAKHEDQPNQVMAAIHGGMADIWLGKTIEAFGTGTCRCE
jgi:hypothetical protein